MMLRYAWSHKDIYDPLYPLLPIAARDGTLRKRMHGTRAAGNVHAKTGTVTGVRSLCGYLTAANGHHIAFSIINQGVNGDDGTASEARNLQDRICEMLCNP
jgi:D-alanyl-D-alanine carboxypeptidase/D-alanyl-D-alanine-endopeptidase (penicillin-binding protein 4)